MFIAVCGTALEGKMKDVLDRDASRVEKILDVLWSRLLLLIQQKRDELKKKLQKENKDERTITEALESMTISKANVESLSKGREAQDPCGERTITKCLQALPDTFDEEQAKSAFNRARISLSLEFLGEDVRKNQAQLQDEEKERRVLLSLWTADCESSEDHLPGLAVAPVTTSTAQHIDLPCVENTMEQAKEDQAAELTAAAVPEPQTTFQWDLTITEQKALEEALGKQEWTEPITVAVERTVQKGAVDRIGVLTFGAKPDSASEHGSGTDPTHAECHSSKDGSHTDEKKPEVEQADVEKTRRPTAEWKIELREDVTIKDVALKDLAWVVQRPGDGDKQPPDAGDKKGTNVTEVVLRTFPEQVEKIFPRRDERFVAQIAKFDTLTDDLSDIQKKVTAPDANAVLKQNWEAFTFTRYLLANPRGQVNLNHLDVSNSTRLILEMVKHLSGATEEDRSLKVAKDKDGKELYTGAVKEVNLSNGFPLADVDKGKLTTILEFMYQLADQVKEKSEFLAEVEELGLLFDALAESELEIQFVNNTLEEWCKLSEDFDEDKEIPWAASPPLVLYVTKAAVQLKQEDGEATGHESSAERTEQQKKPDRLVKALTAGLTALNGNVAGKFDKPGFQLPCLALSARLPATAPANISMPAICLEQVPLPSLGGGGVDVTPLVQAVPDLLLFAHLLCHEVPTGGVSSTYTWTTAKTKTLTSEASPNGLGRTVRARLLPSTSAFVGVG